MMDDWFLYIIQTKNGELYTGITIDTQKRLDDHRQGRGAKYLRGRGPLQLVWEVKVGEKRSALKLEKIIKKFTKSKKKLLISGHISINELKTS